MHALQLPFGVRFDGSSLQPNGSNGSKRRRETSIRRPCIIILKTFQQDSSGTSAGKFPNFRLEMTRRDSRSCYLKSHGVGHVHVTATRNVIFQYLFDSRFRPFCIYILRLDVAFWLTLKYALLKDNKREHLHNVCFLFLLDRGNAVAYNTLQKGHVFDLPSRIHKRSILPPCLFKFI